jgi:hypothetical protein
MTIGKKVALVLGGYLLALFVAYGVVNIYIAMTAGPDRQTYGVMYDFGDSILFLAVFGLAAIPATCIAFYFLRGYRRIWIALAEIGILVAATGIAALVAILAPPQSLSAHPALQSLAALSPLRALIAPMWAIPFVLAGLFSPIRWPRITLILVGLNEAVMFVLVFLHWRQPF